MASSTTDWEKLVSGPAQLQAAQDVLAAVDVALEDKPEKAVLFLSWQRAFTTTSLVVSTGLVAARGGRRIVLIDGGLKERGLSKLADAAPGGGVEALADPNRPVAAALRNWEVNGEQVGVIPIDQEASLPTGAAARPQVLRSAARRLRSTTPLVLVDGPPLTERSVGLALGRGVDGVVLVIDERTTADDAHEMGRRIALAGITVLGYVLAGRSRPGTLSLVNRLPGRPGRALASVGGGRESRST
jgi:Mrp family chromosome partitioning ATPase